MKQITSFTVNHDYITPGIYISRIDGDITTFDLRTRTPNAGDYMDNLTMHSVEHMLATFLRNSEDSDRVIYFGPMGCQTGFYLLTRNVDAKEVFEQTKLVLERKVEMRKLELTYKATFKCHPSGSDYVVTGKFLRYTPVGISLVEKYEPVK